MTQLEIKNYIDITEKWLKKAKPNSHKVKEHKYFEYEGKKYYVDNKNVVLDYSKEELEMAILLEKTLGGEIYMLPRINKPEGIKTADYLWNNEYWNLKEIKSNGKRAIDNALKRKRNQANNFILDFTKNFLTNKEIIIQLKNLYSSKERSWIKSIIIVRNNKIIVIYSRKKETNCLSKRTGINFFLIKL